MRYRATHHTNHVLETPFGDVEIQYPADSACYGGALVHREGDDLVVAYLSHDDDAMHPLESCDGMGEIIGRGKYETRNHSEVDMFEALGLDSYGEKDLGVVQDELDELWKAHLVQMPDSKWEEIVKVLGFAVSGADDNDDIDFVINKLRDELHDHSPFSGVDEALYNAEKYLTCIDANWEKFRAAEPLFEFDVVKLTDDLYDKALSEGRIGNVDAVVLDVYDHSGLHWSISGGGMQCRWDTSSGAGIWVPDDEARKEIDRRAPIYASHFIRQTPLRMHGKNNKYQLMDVQANTCIALSDDWGDLWKMAKTYAKAVGDLTPTQLAIGRSRAAEELAQQALDEYNAWLSGDCHGVIVEHFTLVSEEGDEPEWEQTDEDACWGYVGSDYAKDVMTSEFESAVKALQNATVTDE